MIPKRFYASIGILVSQLNTSVETHQIGPLRYVHFTVCQFYFNFLKYKKKSKCHAYVVLLFPDPFANTKCTGIESHFSHLRD